MLRTYCHEKLPVIPSFKRSRNDLCRLGPEPIGGNVGLPRDTLLLLFIDRVVGLPDDIDSGGLPGIVSESPLPPPIVGDLLALGMSIFDRCFGEQSRDDDGVAITNMYYCFYVQLFYLFISFDFSFVYVLSLNFSVFF